MTVATTEAVETRSLNLPHKGFPPLSGTSGVRIAADIRPFNAPANMPMNAIVTSIIAQTGGMSDTLVVIGEGFGTGVGTDGNVASFVRALLLQNGVRPGGTLHLSKQSPFFGLGGGAKADEQINTYAHLKHVNVRILDTASGQEYTYPNRVPGTPRQ